MIETRAVGAADWQVWRSLRLAALAEAPYAFGSVLADWQGPGDVPERWRARLSTPGSRNLVALLGGRPCGMASGVPVDPPPAAGAAMEVVSMWVAPEARGRGVASVLLDELERWAVTSGAVEVRLAVALANPGAWRLYRRHGYGDTGLREVMPDGVRQEAVLAKPVAR